MVLSQSATGRLAKELPALQCDGSLGWSVETSADMAIWYIKVPGLPNTPYEGDSIEMDVHFPDRYPFQPPSLVLRTPMYHPNIFPDGRVQLEILSYGQEAAGGEGWRPGLNIRTVVLSLMALVSEPTELDEGHAANPEAAKDFKEDKDKYYKKAKEWAAKHAVAAE